MSRDDENKKLAEALVGTLIEANRVSKLTDRQLVREIVACTELDQPCVSELLNRFMPGWTEIDWG